MAEAAAHAMQLIWDTLSNQEDSLTCDPSKIYIGTTDLAAAYQGIDQGLILNEMANNYPRFFPLVAFMLKSHQDDLQQTCNFERAGGYTRKLPWKHAILRRIRSDGPKDRSGVGPELWRAVQVRLC